MRFLDKYSAGDKRLLALERELKRLSYAQSHAPVIPLERPYRRGWEKFYVLVDEVHRRPDVFIFRAMLSQVNRRIYSRDSSFLDRNGHEIQLHPRIIRTPDWIKLAWPSSHQRFFGYGCWELDREPWAPLKWREYVQGFKLVHQWWLREHLQRRLITHQRVELPEVRSRMAEIEGYFEATCGRSRLDWLHGRSHWWRRLAASRNELRSEETYQEQLSENTPD